MPQNRHFPLSGTSACQNGQKGACARRAGAGHCHFAPREKSRMETREAAGLLRRGVRPVKGFAHCAPVPCFPAGGVFAPERSRRASAGPSGCRSPPPSSGSTGAAREVPAPMYSAPSAPAPSPRRSPFRERGGRFVRDHGAAEIGRTGASRFLRLCKISRLFSFLG